MLIGEYVHNIDAKGRLIMPAKFRPELGHSFIVTKGLDGCLFGFPMASWQAIQEKLQKLPLVKQKARAFTRNFYSAATEVEVDKQGRINLPNSLIAYAKIDKECRVIGVADRIEIWSAEIWETYSSQAEEEFESTAEDLMDFDL